MPSLAKIARLQICDEGTFWALVGAAYAATARCLPHRGGYWEPMEAKRGFALYRRYPFDLKWLHERLEQYELFLYSHLLSGRFGPDGVLRSLAHVSRGPSGAYRPGSHPARGMARFHGGTVE